MGDTHPYKHLPEQFETLLERVTPARRMQDTSNVDWLMSYEPWAEKPLAVDAATTIDSQTEQQFLDFVSLWGRQFQAAFSDTETVLQLLSKDTRDAITAQLLEKEKERYRNASEDNRVTLTRIGIHSQDDVERLVRPSVVAQAAAQLLPTVVFARYPEHKPKQRTIPCAFCEDVFVDIAQPQWIVRWSGPPRYCTRCLQRIHHFDVKVKPSFRKAELISNLQHLAAVIGGPPPLTLIGRTEQSGRPLYRAEDSQQRHRLAAALVALPRFPRFATKFRTSNWLDVLETAGIIDGAIRRARGTTVRAVDGTWMRSLAEKHVDDYLTTAGIAHEHEPVWPQHPTLNPSGRRRADWRLEDGTFVEYAGLVGDADYDKKIAEKRRLAEAHKIRLIVLTEPDLLRLPTVIPHSGEGMTLSD